MARYCRKIGGKYLTVLAHACNGWQEDKNQIATMMKKRWSSSSSDLRSRVEIGIDLAGARVVSRPSDGRDHRFLTIHIAAAGSIAWDVLTELRSRVNSSHQEHLRTLEKWESSALVRFYLLYNYTNCFVENDFFNAKCTPLNLTNWNAGPWASTVKCMCMYWIP